MFKSRKTEETSHLRPRFGLEKPTWFNKKAFIPMAVAILLVLAAFFAWQYTVIRDELNLAKNPELAAKTEAEKLAKEVGRYLELPQDESPTLATVSDASKLKQQAFFSKAENNDKVLIYTKAQWAVLYRPATKKVVEYAPVALDNSQ